MPFANVKVTVLILRHFTLAVHEYQVTPVRGIGHLFNPIATTVDLILIRDLFYRMSIKIPTISALMILRLESEYLDVETAESMGTGTRNALDPQDEQLLFAVHHTNIRHNTTSRHIRHLEILLPPLKTQDTLPECSMRTSPPQKPTWFNFLINKYIRQTG